MQKYRVVDHLALDGPSNAVELGVYDEEQFAFAGPLHLLGRGKARARAGWVSMCWDGSVDSRAFVPWAEAGAERSCGVELVWKGLGWCRR